MTYISSKDLQNQYNKLYLLLKEYLWSMNTVEIIAELEISVYKAFPNLSDIQHKLATLRSDIRSVYMTDEEIKDAIDSLMNLASQNTVQYLTIPSFKVV